MTTFGVQYPPLKQLAQTPEFPELLFVKSSNRQDNIERYKWKGANLKNLTTEGERSATGMPSVKGVLITSIEKDSPLAKAGGTVNSVIIEIEGKTVDNLKDLRTQVPKVAQQEKIKLVIFKNQAKEAIELK